MGKKIQRGVADKIKTHISCPVTFFEYRAVWDEVEKHLYSRAGHRWQYGACALHAGYLRLQTHTQNM